MRAGKCGKTFKPPYKKSFSQTIKRLKGNEFIEIDEDVFRLEVKTRKNWGAADLVASKIMDNGILKS